MLFFAISGSVIIMLAEQCHSPPGGTKEIHQFIHLLFNPQQAKWRCTLNPFIHETRRKKTPNQDRTNPINPNKAVGAAA